MKSNNQINIPQAKQAMDQFKMQAAQEVGVNLTNGYNGHLTSREAGSVGGQMVKNVLPERTKFYIRKNRIKEGHSVKIRYIIRLAVFSSPPNPCWKSWTASKSNMAWSNNECLHKFCLRENPEAFLFAPRRKIFVVGCFVFSVKACGR